MASAALAWRDCMLLASSLVLAHRLALLHMGQLPPRRALAAAVDALTIGLSTVGAGLAMLAGIAAAWFGWWQPASEHATALLLMLLLGASWCCLLSSDGARLSRELRPWSWLLAGSAAAIVAYASGFSLAPCLFVVVVAVAMIRTGWLLASDTASALFRGAGE
jgi:hypothetical protein